MIEEDLLELLISILEEDAIISRLYNYFHIHKQYEIAVLNEIIDYGIEKQIFEIENVEDDNHSYFTVDWSSDNTYQEIILSNSEQYIPILFSDNPTLPEEFEKFRLNT